MNRPLIVDLFVEDHAQETFVGELVRRIVREENVEPSLQTRSARGGHSQALREFRNYQKVVEKGALPSRTPDIVVVVIDGNCTTPAKKREEIRKATQETFLHRTVAGCPDPHVERWFLADPDSFHKVVGFRPTVGAEKCEREHYKRLLADAVLRGGQPATLGGIEFASDLVATMDFFRAGKVDSSRGRVGSPAGAACRIIRRWNSGQERRLINPQIHNIWQYLRGGSRIPEPGGTKSVSSYGERGIRPRPEPGCPASSVARASRNLSAFLARRAFLGPS